MKKIARTLNILVMIISVISASIFAAHIPPLWLPFTLSALVLGMTLFLHRSNTKRDLQKAQTANHPLKVFEKIVQQGLSLNHLLAQKEVFSEQDLSRLEDFVEFTTTNMEQIHPQLSEILGMKLFIDLILPFARSERLMNRALSAMIDGYFVEARQNLQESIPYWEHTKIKLEKMEF